MTAFEDLSIWFHDTETNSEGWRRTIRRKGTMAELLEIWDIDDGDVEDMDAIAQVMRYLRSIMQEIEDKKG